MYLGMQMTDASLLETSRHFGGRHRATVMASIAKVEQQGATKEEVDAVIRALEKSIGPISYREVVANTVSSQKRAALTSY